MHLIISLVLFLSLSYDALAAPAVALHHPQQKSKSFRVERVRRSDYVAHGPTALRKAYRKFGIVPIDFGGIDLDDFEPFDVKHTSKSASYSQNSGESEQTGSVSATSVQGDVEFVSPVQIGGQTVVMDFDTGSSDM